MNPEELIAEVESLRTRSGGEHLLPMDFDRLMLMLGGTTWAQEIGQTDSGESES